MECKEIVVEVISIVHYILIETYWNVKSVGKSLSNLVVCILIETYWNVKDRGGTILQAVGNNINRDILECKEETWRLMGMSEEILIETYWNVKYFRSRSAFCCLVYINRDILECKVGKLF